VYSFGGVLPAHTVESHRISELITRECGGPGVARSVQVQS
jgi:hypothetical protein